MTSVTPTSVWVAPHKMFLTKEKNWNPVLEAELFGDPLLVAECVNACFALERYSGLLGSVRCTFRVVVRPNHIGSSATKFAESYHLNELAGVWRWCCDAFATLCRDAERDHELQIKLSQINEEGWDRKAILAVAKERVAAHYELLRTSEASFKKTRRNSIGSAAGASLASATMMVARGSSRDSDSYDSAIDDLGTDAVLDNVMNANVSASRQSSTGFGNALLRNDAVKRKLLKSAGPDESREKDKDKDKEMADNEVTNNNNNNININSNSSNANSSGSKDKPAKPSRRPAPAVAANAPVVDRLRAMIKIAIDSVHEPFPSREQRTIKLSIYVCSFLTLVMVLSRATSFDFFMLLYVAMMYLAIEVARNRRSIMVKLYKRKVARTHRLIGHRLKTWIKKRRTRDLSSDSSGAASSTAVAAALDDAVGDLAELDEEEIVTALIASELD